MIDHYGIIAVAPSNTRTSFSRIALRITTASGAFLGGAAVRRVLPVQLYLRKWVVTNTDIGDDMNQVGVEHVVVVHYKLRLASAASIAGLGVAWRRDATTNEGRAKHKEVGY